MTKRRTYTAAFKANVESELLRKENPLAVEHLPILFADSKRDQAQQQAEHERRLEQLYAEIGRLTTQLAWFKNIWY